MSSRAPGSGPLREARSCHDHLAGRLGTAVCRAAVHRDWVVADGDVWSVADDARERIKQALGLDIRLDAVSRRAAVRPCPDWTEQVPHLAGRLGAAILAAMLDAGWVERTPGSRALAVTPYGADRLRQSGIQGVVVDDSGCDADNLCYSGGVDVTVAGAEDWGELVERATREGWTGVSALAGFSGTVGDAVMGNFSAFGEQVADVVSSVRSWDRVDNAQRTFALTDCGFRPAGSRFSPQDGQGRYDVLDVAFLFRAGTITAPLGDADLTHLLGVAPGERVSLPRVREAVLTASD